MNLEKFAVGVTDWSHVTASTLPGESGTVTNRRCQLGDIQLRRVDYSAGYVADHWCSKGHIIFVVEGDLIVEHQDGRMYPLTPWMSYHIADGDGAPHRVRSEKGASIFVVD